MNDQEKDAPCEDIEMEKANLMMAMKERDPDGSYTLAVSTASPECWQALFELFDQGSVGFALTPVGFRFFRRGRITEREIKARFGDAYVFENKMFGINEAEPWPRA